MSEHATSLNRDRSAAGALVGPAEDVMSYLRLLAGDTPRSDERFEVRWRIGNDRMTRRFISARHPQNAARLIARLARRTDVYVGVALRRAAAGGGKAAIAGAHLLHVDLDTERGDDSPEALPAPLASFALPTLEIASGSPGHRHLYWQLSERLPIDQVEAANRRLAAHLDGDLISADVARILRPPGTLNHGCVPPRPVRLRALRPDLSYTIGELTVRLPADPRPPAAQTAPAARTSRGRTPLDRQLLAIPASEYVRVLGGLTPNRAGKVRCPFHDDHVPSLQLYRDGSWFCFGCRRGGTIYDFAAALAGSGTRGMDFVRLREQLAATFRVGVQLSSPRGCQRTGGANGRAPRNRRRARWPPRQHHPQPRSRQPMLFRCSASR